MSDPSYTGSPATHSRPRSSSVGSVDITDEPSQNPAHSVALQELRRRNIPVHLEAEDRPDREKKDEKPDLIEKFFLNSERPAVALFAISICLVGVMNFLPAQAHDPNTWEDKLEKVNGVYGPGAVISWCLFGISMLYDANQVYKQGPNGAHDGFHYFKYASLIFTSVGALGDAIWRALHMDFGPSYAAALYMSDKGFELATLLYTLQHFPIHRVHQQPHPDEERSEPQRQPQGLRSHAVAAINQYKIYPCIAMVSIWVWCRALSNGHTVYNIDAQNPYGATKISWKPILPSYWKPILATICFALSSLVSVLTSWGWWSWSLPVGILSSFGICHSGLFAIYTPFKMTSIGLHEQDQLLPLISTALILIVQYGRKMPIVKKAVHKLRELANADRNAGEEESQSRP